MPGGRPARGGDQSRRTPTPRLLRTASSRSPSSLPLDPVSRCARGSRVAGSRTGRSPAAVAAPEASLRRLAGSPMIGRRETGAGGRAAVFAYSGPSHVRVIGCGQCRWLQSSLRVSPAVAGGHGAGPRQDRRSCGATKCAPAPRGGGGADNSAAALLASGQGGASHAAWSAPVAGRLSGPGGQAADLPVAQAVEHQGQELVGGGDLAMLRACFPRRAMIESLAARGRDPAGWCGIASISAQRSIRDPAW